MRMELIVPCWFANLLDDLFKMNSALYEGHVTHIRYLPIKKRFDYSLFMLFLDLDLGKAATSRISPANTTSTRRLGLAAST